jgi:Fe-S cluster assembly ATP-binding protein
MKKMLSVKGLKASVENQEILHGLDLEVRPGEVHAIMGPNGSGKSTLAHILAALEPEERARRGLFLAFQYPVELPGMNNSYFLKAAVNAIRSARGEPELDALRFMKFMREKLALVNMDEGLLKRSVNVGFSGGEKKRNEIFQMALLEPRLAILDETDSGLDIDALRIVADGINALRSPDRAMILVTHYQRLLSLIEPDYVHVLAQGRILRSGDKSLALELEKKGYAWITEEQAA